MGAKKKLSIFALLVYRLLWSLSKRRMKRDLWRCLQEVMFPQVSLDSYLKYIDYLESLERMPNGESLRMFSEACGAAWRAIQQAWTSPRGLWLLLTWARMMQHACRQLGYPDLSQAPEYVRWALLIFVSGFYLNPRGGVSLDEAARAVGVACVGQIFALHGAIPTFNDATWFIAQLPLKDMARVVQERSEPMRVTVQAFWGEVIQQDGSW